MKPDLSILVQCIVVVSVTSISLRADEPRLLPVATVPPGASTSVRPAVTVETARIQAASLHDALHAALQLTHDRFYREDEGLPIPAAVLKEVFAELKQKQNITLRWLVVEGQAMNTDHEAKTDFQREAVAALKSGKLVHEQVTDRIYRRAGAITLSNHCLKCHVPDRRNTRDRTAGLLITIPLKQDTATD